MYCIQVQFRSLNSNIGFGDGLEILAVQVHKGMMCIPSFFFESMCLHRKRLSQRSLRRSLQQKHRLLSLLSPGPQYHRCLFLVVLSRAWRNESLS